MNLERRQCMVMRDPNETMYLCNQYASAITCWNHISMPKKSHLSLVTSISFAHISKVINSNPTHRRLFMKDFRSSSRTDRSRQMTMWETAKTVSASSMRAISPCFKSDPMTAESKNANSDFFSPFPPTNTRKLQPLV